MGTEETRCKGKEYNCADPQHDMNVLHRLWLLPNGIITSMLTRLVIKPKQLAAEPEFRCEEQPCVCSSLSDGMNILI